MPTPPPSYEAVAIVRATMPEVSARHAAVALRMWHHLPPPFDREAIFGSYGASHEQITLIQALLQAIAIQPPARMPLFRAPAGLCSDQGPQLEHAFRQALIDILGPLARNIVLNAWCQLLRAFLGVLCRPLGRPTI